MTAKSKKSKKSKKSSKRPTKKPKKTAAKNKKFFLVATQISASTGGGTTAKNGDHAHAEIYNSEKAANKAAAFSASTGHNACVFALAKEFRPGKAPVEIITTFS